MARTTYKHVDAGTLDWKHIADDVTFDCFNEEMEIQQRSAARSLKCSLTPTAHAALLTSGNRIKEPSARNFVAIIPVAS